MDRGITRNNTTTVKPFLVSLHQLGANRVCECVKTKTGKRVPHPLLFSQDVVVRLVLPLPPATECWLKVRPQKLHRVKLVRFSPHPHPNKMQVVRHQAIRRAEKLFARSSVKHEFAKRGVKILCQPTACSLVQGVRPENHRVPLIEMLFKPWKIPFFWWQHGGSM